MTDTDKQYRELVRQDAHRLDDLVYFLKHSEYGPIHHHSWLQLMGLMETWDIV